MGRSRLWGPLTLASSLVWLLITPAASAVAASAPTIEPGSVTLTASATSVKPGQSVTFTASASDPLGTAEYQFWVELPNGRWEDAQNYSTDNTFVLSDVSAGSYLVAVDALDKAQVSAGAWSSAQTTLADGVFVDSQVLAVSLDQDVAPGTPVTLLGQATSIYDPLFQFWVEAPDGTWSQSGNYSKSNTYTFTPSQPGKYRFVAYAKSPLAANNPDGALQSAVGSSGVYGTASQVVITVASPADVADGQEPDTVTATVEDQYGNRVADFTGYLDIQATGSAQLSPTGASLFFANVSAGTANASLVLPSGDVGVTTITADHLVSAPTIEGSFGEFGGQSGQGEAANVTYGSATVTGVANAAYALTLQSSLVGLSDNTVNADDVTVGLIDQGGYAYIPKSGRYVTLSLTGPGSFSRSSSMSSVTEYISPTAPSGTITVPVYSQQGDNGTIVVTASSSGVFSPAPLDIATYETGMPTGLQISEANGQDNAGDVYTLYTVDVVDQAGQVITSGPGSTDAIQISDNVAALQDPTLYYYTGGRLQKLLVDGDAYPSTTSDANTTVADPVVTTLSAVGGQVQFAVENGFAGFPATITATDLSTGATASGTYNYYDNAYLAAEPLGPLSAQHYGPQSVEAGQTLTVSAELTDAYGNPVPEKGQPIWFGIPFEFGYPSEYASDPPDLIYQDGPEVTSPTPGLVDLPNGASNIGDIYEAFTNSSGIATIQLTVPSGDPAYSYFAVGAFQEDGGGFQSYIVLPKQYQPASLAWTGGFPADGRISAGATGTISADVLNALGTNLVYNSADPFNYFLLTSSNSGVLALSSSALDHYAEPVAPGEWIISAAGLFEHGSSTGQINIPVTGMMSGSTTLTLQDLAPGVAPISQTITVLPGQAMTGADLWYDGAPVSASNPMDLTANVPVPISVVNVDAGGNPVAVSGSTGKEIDLPESLPGVKGQFDWEPAGGGAPISEVEIPPGQTSASVWFVASTTQVVSQFPADAFPPP